jgi:hypothetical protein
MSIPSSNVRPLTREQRRALEQFASLEITMQDLCRRLNGIMEVDLRPAERKVLTHFAMPEPPIRIEKWNIENALAKKKTGAISEQELSEWATMLELNQAYDWQGKDEDEIGEWLSDLTMLTLEHMDERDDG